MWHDRTVPCLLYCTPQDPDSTRVFALQSEVTCIGRLMPNQADALEATVLHLDLQTVSMRHAKISRTNTGYTLYNWEGQFGIGLYERELGPQEERALKHCDVFHIPAREEHVRFQFLESEDKTQVIPLEVEHQRQKVYVFSERVHLTANQYRLLAHLHRHKGQVCSYDALMAAVWNDANLVGRKGNLEVLLHDVRAKLRAASGGFTFMETVRGQGVRLVV